MIKIRPSKERGHADHGWLESYHTFSFAGYQDLKYMGFRTFRVINEDGVTPAEGFGTHPHRDMEIITYVLEGALEHRDSMGNGSMIRPGEIQIMSAGTGVSHSEYNHSKEDPVHFLQIWILPQQHGLKPSYQQRKIDIEKRLGHLILIAGKDGSENSAVIHQDVDLYAGMLSAGDKVSFPLGSQRYAWLQVARGALTLNGNALNSGDGAAMGNEKNLHIKATEDTELLLFDLG